MHYLQWFTLSIIYSLPLSNTPLHMPAFSSHHQITLNYAVLVVYVIHGYIPTLSTNLLLAQLFVSSLATLPSKVPIFALTPYFLDSTPLFILNLSSISFPFNLSSLTLVVHHLIQSFNGIPLCLFIWLLTNHP